MFLKSGLDPATAVMSANNNIFHFEVLYSELYHSKGINIRKRGLVGDISVNEQLSSLKANYLISRNSWVWAAYPEKFRFLAEF